MHAVLTFSSAHDALGECLACASRLQALAARCICAWRDGARGIGAARCNRRSRVKL
jgi:hypothetical protein